MSHFGRSGVVDGGGTEPAVRLELLVAAAALDGTEDEFGGRECLSLEPSVSEVAAFSVAPCGVFTDDGGL